MNGSRMKDMEWIMNDILAGDVTVSHLNIKYNGQTQVSRYYIIL